MGIKLPVISIVGRPNVGKSTLFNRIVGHRKAIVHETEGITRDRMSFEAEWVGYRFLIEDTGGYIPQSKDLIDQAVKAASLSAIDSADFIIFLVDATTGITKEDEALARVVKRSKKPFILASNKIDNEMMVGESGVFYGLGMGEVHPLSALNGRRVGDFLDEIVKSLDQLPPMEEVGPVIKFALVGRPNAGKSSLTNALLGIEKQIVTDVPGTTRDSINSKFRYYDEDYEMVDTAGLRKRTKVDNSPEFYSTVRTQHAITAADVVVLVVDATENFNRQDAKLATDILEANKGLIIAVNKWDLIEKDSKSTKRFEDEIVYDMDTLKNYPIIFVSALSKQRIFKIVDLVKEIHGKRQQKIATRKLNTWLEGSIGRYHPPAISGYEVKINYVTQVAIQPPVFVFYCNHPTSITEAYKRYLENRLRETFDFFGVQIRLFFRDKN
jgi:GTPase